MTLKTYLLNYYHFYNLKFNYCVLLKKLLYIHIVIILINFMKINALHFFMIMNYFKFGIGY